MHDVINYDRQQLEAFCQANAVKRLSLFGSARHDQMRPDSDIDLLVEFEPGVRVGLFRLGGMQMDLTEMFGRFVDLKTPGSFPEPIRQPVQRDAEVLYEHH